MEFVAPRLVDLAFGDEGALGHGQPAPRQAHPARHVLFDQQQCRALLGTEVKALRNAKVQMSDAYVFIKNGEAFLSNMHIGEYSHGNRENHAPMRVRKLLLNKSELNKIEAALNEKGLTIVPTQMYFVKGKAKIEIGVGKGKKTHDKRQTIKENESKRELARIRKR